MSVSQPQVQASIITQVGDINDVLSFSGQTQEQGESANQNMKLDLRGVEFELTRHELLNLPESILLGISNGLVMENNMGAGNLLDVGSGTVNFSPDCLQYTLDMFRKVAKEVVPIPNTDPDSSSTELLQEESFTQSSIALKKSRRAIIVLREDLDYYCLPTEPEVAHEHMRLVKQQCGDELVKQNKVFTGLRKSDDPGSAEQHLIEMLCSSGFKIDDDWGFRASEPGKSVISSLSLTRLLTQEPDENMDEASKQEALFPHKLLLFWRKPARKCWWDSMELKVDGCDQPVRVHIRRVWTLELSVVR